MVVVGIATLPERHLSFINTCASLHPQVDNLISKYGIDFPGDGWKFEPYFSGWMKDDDICFFCDDDLIYPGDYVTESIKHLNKYPDAVLSYHGREMKPRPVTSYYKSSSRIAAYHCLSSVEDYHVIDGNGTLGTGVMFFRYGTLKIKMSDFIKSNMADIIIAGLCFRQNKRMIVCPHNEGWIKYQLQPKGSTIWEKHYDDDSAQTEMYNSICK